MIAAGAELWGLNEGDCGGERGQEGAVELEGRRGGLGRRIESREEDEGAVGIEDSLCDEAQGDGACSDTRRIRAVKSCFMLPR